MQISFFSQSFNAIVPQTGDCLKKQASVAGILYVLHDMAENCGKLMHDNHGKFRRTAFSTFWHFLLFLVVTDHQRKKISIR